VLALRYYGGSAEKIWKALSAGRGLATKEEANLMAQQGDVQMVGKWVESLTSQSEARRGELLRATGGHWPLLSGALVFAWVIALPVGWLLQSAPEAKDWKPDAFVFLLFLAPMLAGASGATVRMFLPQASTPNVKSISLGLAAGAISGVLLVSSHLLATPDIHKFAILLTAVASGFIAGLTFDNVFKKLESVEALQSPVAQKRSVMG
jgi:hypothetical protein